MERILIVAAASLGGGFVQAVTGFGGAIVLMLVLPVLFTMTGAAAVSDIITMVLSFMLFWQYRKHVNIPRLIVPAVCYLLVSTLAIYRSAGLDSRMMKIWFGVFLIILAGYFLLFSKTVKVKASLPVSMFCASLAGLCGGLFGISGPPVSLYYLSVSETKEEYLGTLNAFFSLIVVFNVIARIMNGFIGREQIPVVLTGMAAILTGCAIGSSVVVKIEEKLMRNGVYILMIIAGIKMVVGG